MESTRICPLCQSDVRFFFIHLNEKVLMCENTQCEFPFGHEDLHLVKEDYDVDSDVEITSLKSKLSTFSNTNGSIISTAAWSEIDKINRVIDSDNLEIKTYLADKTVNTINDDEKKHNEIEILKNLESMKVLSNELVTLEESDSENHCLKNEKWLRNLKNKQDVSGLQLLKPEEVKFLDHRNSQMNQELKIEIDPGSNNTMSSIRIEIMRETNLTDDSKSDTEILNNEEDRQKAIIGSNKIAKLINEEHIMHISKDNDSEEKQEDADNLVEVYIICDSDCEDDNQ